MKSILKISHSYNLFNNIKENKSLIINITFLLLAVLGFSQEKSVSITGRIMESSSNQPVAYATVLVVDVNTKENITGTTTTAEGSFQLQTEVSNFYIEITFIGLKTKRIFEFQQQNGTIDLGNILLEEDLEKLDAIIVEAEVSKTEFKLDKRIFNIGKDLSSTGASALEVLNNVPSVNVNIEGDISLRGSQGVQILINGKPSIIASDSGNALGTITADMMERVEVITNPSAKYDAEGTSGIINIILKKEERKGLNGSASVNIGDPTNHSFGLSLNRRTEKFNLFSQLGVGYRKLPNDRKNINRDLINNTTLESEGTEYRNEKYYNIVLGTDYHINKNNILTLSGNFAYEIEEQPSETNFSLFDGNELTNWKRTEETEATNPKYQYELQYKKDFDDHEDHMLLFSALGQFFGKEQSSDFEDLTLAGDDRDAVQKTRTDFKEANHTFKFDYTKPFNEKFTIETGAQYLLNNVSNDFEVKDLVGSEFISDPNQTNVFEFNQNVLGIYGTAAYEGDKWGVKVGLRVENTDLETFLVNTNEQNDQNYSNLFPSFHSSYKFSNAYSLQMGYSRRVYRPRLWDLNPFFNIRNNFNIRTGNPDLLPEFTDSFELTNIYNIGKASLNFGVYYRYTTNTIERSVSVFENNVNTYKPYNIGTTDAIGIEVNGKYPVAKWLVFNGDINYNTFQRQGDFNGISIDFNANQWTGKLTSKIGLPADIDFEVTGNYQSDVKTVQGKIAENIFADLGFRKKIIKGKGVLNFSVRDIFASRIRKSETIQENFYLLNRSFRGRFITFGFSYGFGKGEAMEYSGQRRRR
ncbi:outer membrane receptor protein involved in Fe transport [Seonamhaeicola aphaedonensis]|uniref:Outer membrane receptor protein involved in Fe transport n=1 Tax=Seonamhaeicola aphaedonensis TaxID=1461338 RepID=A0A3D9HIA6_9FLAO|nr:outer membrane receptor protein involved in Fe transport [Seonamhaeicola aphaedonensis]